MLARGAGRAPGGLGAGSAFGKMAPARDGASLCRVKDVFVGLQAWWQSGTCVEGEASLADEQLGADGSAGMQPVQPLGDAQEPAGGVDPVQEAVNQEHHGAGRAAVPGQDGGLQISLKKSTGVLRETRLQRLRELENVLPQQPYS